MSRAMAGVLVLGLLMAMPQSAAASGAELRLGGFMPSADSNLFDDDDDLYGTEDDDWRSFTGGLEFSFDLGPNVELGLHVDGYGRQLSTSYREFTHSDDSEIRQELKLSVVPVGASLRILPAGKRAALSPYIAAGVDVVGYKYEEFGEFIDFRGDFEILDDAFIDEGAAFGWHAAAGLRVRINYDVYVTGEVRYLNSKTDMGEDFAGNRIDLGGIGATVGVNIRF
jgi:opacity protein-like surface antigen